MEGEGKPTIIIDAGRVGVRRKQGEDVCIISIRNISMWGPSITVAAREPQTTIINIDEPAANEVGAEKVIKAYRFNYLWSDALRQGREASDRTRKRER